MSKPLERFEFAPHGGCIGFLPANPRCASLSMRSSLALEGLVACVGDVQDLVLPEMLDGYLAKVVVECVDLSEVG